MTAITTTLRVTRDMWFCMEPKPVKPINTATEDYAKCLGCPNNDCNWNQISNEECPIGAQGNSSRIYRTWTRKDDEEIIALRAKGLTARAIAIRLQANTSSVQYRIKVLKREGRL